MGAVRNHTSEEIDKELDIKLINYSGSPWMPLVKASTLVCWLNSVATLSWNQKRNKHTSFE